MPLDPSPEAISRALVKPKSAAMQFQREQLTAELFAELLPLFTAHYKEIAYYQDIPFDPNLDAYKAAADQGALRLYTVREDDRELIGYSVYFLRHNLHFQSSLQAAQDVLFVRPDCRGIGARFIDWCDQQLKADGVQAVYLEVTVAHEFGPMLERLGYELLGRNYGRRLDE